MTVKGRVVSLSHTGGLLVEFEGKAPGLGWEVRIEGGRAIGRVDSVIGGIENALVHVSLSEKIDSSSAIGAPIEVGMTTEKIGISRKEERGGEIVRRRGLELGSLVKTTAARYCPHGSAQHVEV